MTSQILLYAGSAALVLWGAAHLVPTRAIVRGFGALSADNARILTMEWMAEGLTLCFLGVLTGLVTANGAAAGALSALVIQANATMLLLMAVLSLATGARTAVLPMRLCPAVKTGVAVLFILGTL